VPALHHKVCVAQDLLADNALNVLAHALKILRPHCCRLICTLLCSSSARHRQSRHNMAKGEHDQIMSRLNLCVTSASICGNLASKVVLTTGLGFLFRSYGVSPHSTSSRFVILEKATRKHVSFFAVLRLNDEPRVLLQTDSCSSATHRLIDFKALKFVIFVAVTPTGLLTARATTTSSFSHGIREQERRASAHRAAGHIPVQTTAWRLPGHTAKDSRA
jgi:hypothetical protein